MEDFTDYKHLKQKEFLQVSYSTDHVKKLQEMNNLEEIQCWSDSQIRIENSIKYNMTQQEMYNSKLMNTEFLNNEQNKSLISLQSQQQEADIPERIKMCNSINMKDKRFSIQRRFTPHNINEQNRSYIDGSSKIYEGRGINQAKDKQSSFNQRARGSSVRKAEVINANNLQLFSKIMIKILQFYRLYTVSGRTSVINNEIKEYIRDSSDNLLLDFRNNQGIYLILKKIQKYIDKIGRFRMLTQNQESSIIYWILVLFTLINCVCLYIYSCLIIFQPEQSLVHNYLFVLKIIWIFELSFKICSQAQLSDLNNSENTQTTFPYFTQSALQDIIPLFIIITILSEYPIFQTLVFVKIGNCSNVATTIIQALFTSVVMLFITITFGYILNVIADILQQMDEDVLQKRKDINIINEYMRDKNISKSLQQKINLYLEYYYDKNCSKTQEQNDEVLQKISSDLQNQIIKEYNKKIFNKIQILTSNFSYESLEELSLFVKEEQYFPNQFLTKDSEVVESSIMFIISGKVELYHNPTNDEIKNYLSYKKLSNGDILGEIGFFTGQSESYIAKSTEFTKIIKIDRQNFINIIKKKENDYEKYCQIKDNILFYQEYKDLKMCCLLCKFSNHQINDCFLTHFNKERAYYVIGASQKVTQMRKSFQRKLKNKQKSLRLIKVCLETSYFIQNNYSQTPMIRINNSDSDYNETLLSSEDDKIIDLDPSLENEFDSKQNINNMKTQEEIIPRSTSIVEQIYHPNQTQNDLGVKNSKYIAKQISLQIQESSDFNSQENIVQLQKDIKEISEQPSQMDFSSLKVGYERKKASNLVNSQFMINFDLKDYTEKDYPKSMTKKRVKNQSSFSSNNIIKTIDNDEQRLRQSQTKLRQRGSIRSKNPERQRGGVIENEQTIFNLHQQIQLLNEKYLGKQGLIEESNNIFNPWDLESLKDYQYYFHTGNSKYMIFHHQKNMKKRNKLYKSEKLKK